MTDSTQEIDEILELLHNSWLEDDYDTKDPDAIEAKQALLDWHYKQVEEVLDRLLREYELDIQSKWFSSSGGMVDLSSAIEAERERLGK